MASPELTTAQHTDTEGLQPKSQTRYRTLRRAAPPAASLAQPFTTRMLEEPNFVAAMFEFVDVGPDFRQPRLFMGRGQAARGASRVKGNAWLGRGRRILQFDKHAAHFFDLFLGGQNVLVAQQVLKPEFEGFCLRFLARVKRPVFGPQILSRVAGHPKNILVFHPYPQPKNLSTRWQIDFKLMNPNLEMNSGLGRERVGRTIVRRTRPNAISSGTPKPGVLGMRRRTGPPVTKQFDYREMVALAAISSANPANEKSWHSPENMLVIQDVAQRYRIARN